MLIYLIVIFDPKLKLNHWENEPFSEIEFGDLGHSESLFCDSLNPNFTKRCQRTVKGKKHPRKRESSEGTFQGGTMEDLFEQITQSQQSTQKRRKRSKKLTESEELKARALRDAMGASFFSMNEHIDAEREFLDRDHAFGDENLGGGEIDLGELDFDSLSEE